MQRMRNEKDVEIANFTANLAKHVSLGSHESKYKGQTSTSLNLPIQLNLKTLIVEGIGSIRLPLICMCLDITSHIRRIKINSHSLHTTQNQILTNLMALIVLPMRI